MQRGSFSGRTATRRLLCTANECGELPHTTGHADNVLQALNWELAHPIEWQSIASSRFLQLVSGDLIGLEDAEHFVG